MTWSAWLPGARPSVDREEGEGVVGVGATSRRDRPAASSTRSRAPRRARHVGQEGRRDRGRAPDDGENDTDALPKIYGVGPVITALTLGEVGDVARFADRNHFASYNGTAPDDKGSAGNPAHCVNIKGNRKLNHAIHMIAITQIRTPQTTVADSSRAREGKRGRLSQPA